MNKLKSKPWFVYIARCRNNSFYTGIAQSVDERISAHNLGQGALSIKHKRPIKLLYTERNNDYLSARRRERQIKGWNKTKKENLIKYGHPKPGGKN